MSGPAKGESRGEGQGRQRARREVSAGGVVYRVDEGGAGTLFLLIRDSYKNWGFPKGHLEQDELRGEIETIDWYFRFRGRLIHKVCHFYLMETSDADTKPQRAEGITACRWAPFDDAVRLVSYANARQVLRRAHAMVNGEGDRMDARPAAGEAQGLVDATLPESRD